MGNDNKQLIKKHNEIRDVNISVTSVDKKV